MFIWVFFTEKRVRVIANVEERKAIVSSIHEGSGSTIQSKSLGGHLGRDKCLAKITER